MTTQLQLCLYSIGIALVWLVVIAAASTDDDLVNYPTTSQAVRRKASSLESKLKYTPPIAEWAQQQGRNCQNLCGHCNCRGFYCGEECICECNNENSDTECIARMQTNAKQMNIPFELLIQGPSSNRFVRNAMLFGHEMPALNHFDNEQPMRNKRSTVVIYKPEPETEAGAPELQANERFRRSSGQLDWFNDLTAALTRPAPINNKRSKTQSLEDSVSSFLAKRSPKLDFDSSWFTDNNSQGLLRPAPLSKRQNSKRRSESFDASNEFSDAMAVVENIPRAIKNTLRSLQQENTNSNSNMEDDLNDFWTGLPRNDLRTKAAPKETLKDTLKNDKAMQEMQRWRDNLVEAFERFMEKSKQRSSTSSTSTSTSTSTTSTTPAAILGQQHGQLLVPQWFRPMRFLQRVSEVLNESAK